MVMRDTDAMEGIASPRNPSVRMRSMSDSSLSLLVPCGSRHNSASSASMPQASAAALRASSHSA